MDELIRLRDDVIFQLKQQIATLQQRISDLEHRNEELEELSLLPIKEEGISIVLFGICVRIACVCVCRR